MASDGDNPQPPARGRPRDEAIDGAVLDATEALLPVRGYEAMSVEQVAATAGVSKPTLYLRYPSKRELVAAMIDRLRPPLPDRQHGSVADDLVALIEMQRAWVEQHGLRIVAAVLLERVDHPDLFDRFQDRVVGPVRDAFASVLAAGVARGELSAGADAAETLDALTGAVWARGLATDDDAADWSARLVETLLRGLAAGAPSPSAAHPG
jgi:AcrR family transcriptional regulator